MSDVGNLLLGFNSILQPELLFYCLVGVLLGTLVGVLPGISALAGVSLLLPLSYHLSPMAAIIMLAGVYYGSQYGGSTTAILMNLPGTPPAAVTCLDGHPMAKNGQASLALFLSAVASFVSGVIGIVILVIGIHTISNFSLMFGPSDYFSIIILGLIAASVVNTDSPVKGFIAMTIGMLTGTIGVDVNTGTSRFDIGVSELYDGINVVVLALGLFGVAEIISTANTNITRPLSKTVTFKNMWPKWSTIKQTIMPIIRATGIGAFFGALPGTGPTLSSFVAYATEKRLSKHPEKFGKGATEGVVAPEAANNAAAQTEFIPTLALGIPGDSVMALIISALTLHGIQPGPTMINNQPDLFWTLVASFFVGNVLLLILNIPLIKIWVYLLQIPYKILYLALLMFIAFGAYSINSNVFDIFMVVVIGAIGYVLRLFKFEFAPILLGFVLGPLLEENFKRAMSISGGDLSVFVLRPISLTFLVASAILVIWSIRRWSRST